MPLQVIVGEKNLAAGKIELKVRKGNERILVERAELVKKAGELLG